ncbi:hypothetical protein [Alloyangia pacifica]
MDHFQHRPERLKRAIRESKRPDAARFCAIVLDLEFRRAKRRPNRRIK